MINDKDFINKVWEKYNNYENSDVQETFFKKHQYNKPKTIIPHNLSISFILVIITTIGVVYANVITHNILFTQRNTNTIPGLGYEYYKEMTMNPEGIFYKRIYNYDEYLKVTEKFNNLVEMNETDFQDSFFLIIAGQNYNTTSLYISDIYIEDDTTCVELKRKAKWSLDTTVISAKISKELDRENIKIKNLPNIISSNEKYTELTEIPIDYTVNQALNDGYFVVENWNQIISNNKTQLDEFIEKKENGVLRICRYYKDVYIVIMDVQYNNGIVNINYISINLEENQLNPPIYFTGNEITKLDYKHNNENYIQYMCTNELGDTMEICTIKK